MVSNEKKILAFLLENVTSEEIEKKYKQNYITKEKTDLFRGFTLKLGDYIFDTYLGIEFIKTKEDIEGHLKWCINTTLNDFNKMGFTFKMTTELYDYFYSHFEDSIYTPIDNFVYTKKTNKTYLNKIFQYDNFTDKKRLDLDTLIEYYQILNNSFNKEKIVPLENKPKRSLQSINK